MWDARVAELAGRQFNRVSRQQLLEIGLSDAAITRWTVTGRLTLVEEGVFAVGTALEHDSWGRWMAATLTAPGSVLSHQSAAAAWGLLSEQVGASNGHPRWERRTAAPRRRPCISQYDPRGGLHRRSAESRSRSCRGPCSISPGWWVIEPWRGPCARPFAWSLTTLPLLGDSLGRYRGRRGVRRLAATIARYAGLPLERARSGAEVRALELLRGRRAPAAATQRSDRRRRGGFELAAGEADRRSGWRALPSRRGRGRSQAARLGAGGMDSPQNPIGGRLRAAVTAYLPSPRTSRSSLLSEAFRDVRQRAPR